MRIVVDTNIIIGQLVHRASRARLVLRQPGFEVGIADAIWTEANEKLELHFRYRVEKGGLDAGEQAAEEKATRDLLAYFIRIEPRESYTANETDARVRMERDPDDWPTLAVAISTDAGIWTGDKNHFWGCGVATWRTGVIAHVLGVK